MFPGISVPPEGMPSFAAGEIWTVKVPGNPAPIAVRVSLDFVMTFCFLAVTFFSLCYIAIHT